jgi:mono/diheme cytochrome c family protein
LCAPAGAARPAAVSPLREGGFAALSSSGGANRYGAADMESSQPESKRSRRAVMALVVVAFAFGLVVPVLVLTANAADRASVAPGGVRLDASEQKGRELFSHACNLCHTLQAVNAVGRTGPNLDVLVPTVAPSARVAFVLDAIDEGEAHGFGQMPAQLYQGKEAEDVAKFVAAVAGH